MRHVTTVVPLHIAKCRCLVYMYRRGYVGSDSFMKASEVADQIWPGVKYTAQGVGATASKILRALNKEGLVRWNIGSKNEDWGYALTTAGFKAGREIAENENH